MGNVKIDYNGIDGTITEMFNAANKAQDFVTKKKIVLSGMLPNIQVFCEEAGCVNMEISVSRSTGGVVSEKYSDDAQLKCNCRMVNTKPIKNIDLFEKKMKSRFKDIVSSEFILADYFRLKNGFVTFEMWIK